MHATPSIDVACVADDAYALPLAVTLASARHFLAPGRHLRVFLLDGGLRPATLARLRRSVEDARLTLLPIAVGPTELRDYPGFRHLTWLTYTRLLVPERLPADVSRVLWLDSDLVVCHDLGALWDQALAGAHVLARIEATIGQHLPFAPALGVPLTTPYFNAGVMLLDLARLRATDFTTRALRLLAERHDQLVYGDQDVLNLVCAGHASPLDPRWNHVPAHDPPSIVALERDRLRPHPFIVHYASTPKPWQFGYAYTRPFASYWYHAVELTAWRGFRPPVPPRHTLRTQLEALVARRWPSLVDLAARVVRRGARR